MKLTIKKGTTSKLLRIFITDSSKTDGSGLTGLVHNSAGLTAYYIREGAASATAISLVTATVGTFTSSGFKEVDATNMPGVYELHPPNTCIASGADSVVIFLKGATNMASLPLEIQLDDNTAKDVYDRVPSNLGDVPTAAELISAHGAGAWTTVDVSALATSTELTIAESNIRGADNDDLKNISDQIDAIPTSMGIADAVWDEDLTTHNTSKSAGWFVKQIKAIAEAILSAVT